MPGARGGENGELLFFSGYKSSIWDDENVVEIDGGDSSTTLWMYLMPLNLHLKMAEMINFMSCIFKGMTAITYKSRTGA